MVLLNGASICGRMAVGMANIPNLGAQKTYATWSAVGILVEMANVQWPPCPDNIGINMILPALLSPTTSLADPPQDLASSLTSIAKKKKTRMVTISNSKADNVLSMSSIYSTGSSLKSSLHVIIMDK